MTGFKPNIPLTVMDFWSDVDDAVTVDSAAADENLPSIVVEDIPAGATIDRVVGMFKYTARTDSSSAENYVEAAQIISIDSDVARTSVVTMINLPTGSLQVDADKKEGGDVIIGDNDVSAEVTGNATYYVTWELADVHGNDMVFQDVQVGVRIYFY